MIDTNVISEFVRPAPDAGVRAFLGAQRESTLFISVMTWAELRFGIIRMADGQRKAGLLQWLETDLALRFADRIVAIDRLIADQWAHSARLARAAGLAPGTADLLIAASALVCNFTLVTRNVRDFEPLGVKTINPWAA